MNQPSRATPDSIDPGATDLKAANAALAAEIELLRDAAHVLVHERGELEQRVRDLAEALERAAADAKDARADATEANRLQETCLTAVSHALRTPLQGMLSWSQILERVVLDPERARHAAQRVVANVNSQARMLDDLLDFSRALRGGLSLQPEWLDLAPVVHRAANAARASIAEMAVSLEVEVGAVPLGVFADPARMEQALASLMSNAIHAVDAGGRVRVDCIADATHVVVRVEDWGRGIDAPELPHLFEPFRQTRRSRKLHQGLGLGLVIARHIVEGSGGELSASSDGLGCGATFSLRLPHANPSL